MTISKGKILTELYTHFWGAAWWAARSTTWGAGEYAWYVDTWHTTWQATGRWTTRYATRRWTTRWWAAHGYFY